MIKWKHFPRYWPFVWGIHRWPVNFPHKGRWRGALLFSLICALTNGWVNKRNAGDLIHHRAHFDVTAMISRYFKIPHPYLGFHIDEVPTDFVYSWARRYKVWTAICIPDIGQNFIEVHDTGQICRNGVDSRHKQTIGMASVVWKCEWKWKGDGYDLSSIVTFYELWLNHQTLWCIGTTRKHFTKIWYKIHYHISYLFP